MPRVYKGEVRTDLVFIPTMVDLHCKVIVVKVGPLLTAQTIVLQVIRNAELLRSCSYFYISDKCTLPELHRQITLNINLQQYADNNLLICDVVI